MLKIKLFLLLILTFVFFTYIGFATYKYIPSRSIDPQVAEEVRNNLVSDISSYVSYILPVSHPNVIKDEIIVEGSSEEEDVLSAKNKSAALPKVIATNSYTANFSNSLILEESESMPESKSPNWWLNSGAKFIVINNIAKTIQGELSEKDPWRLEYSSDNPEDTDNGFHPQNIFRLITKTKWKDFTQQAYFKINKDNFSSSENRNESNGILLFNRYQDSQTLYYAGLRVDGFAVIKKKYKGNYYTMVIKKVFSGTYNRSNKPDLMPKDTWIGLKVEVKNTSSSEVSIKLYTDVGRTGTWTQVLDTKDAKKKFGREAIVTEGYGGIRTDFMDVEFSDYKISQL